MFSIFKYIGLGALGALLAIGGIFFYFNSSTASNEEIFVPFIETNIRQLSSWDKEKYFPLMTEEEVNRYSPKQWDQIMSELSKFGKFKSYEHPKLMGYHTLNPFFGGDKVTSATYSVWVNFESYSAELTISMKGNEDKVQITGARWKRVL
ncbi:hypothetical protein SOPP22_14285 [Shewanella sp. OPT22]|nr:hypothetical protein SOPP22_14285 [Shewanella sp. OPT22]